MKSILTIIELTLLFSLLTFSQERSYRDVFPHRLTDERLREIHKQKVNDFQESYELEFLLLKSKIKDWQTEFRNPQKEFYKEGRVNAKDSRTILNKTQLENGFLLIEQIGQTWYGSVWINDYKHSYMYDGNNNQTAHLW